jgi:integrase
MFRAVVAVAWPTPRTVRGTGSQERRVGRGAARVCPISSGIFAAATGLCPAEWPALEWRDIDLDARVVYVHRSFTKGRLKCPKTAASRQAVPLQTIALEAIEHQPSSRQSALVFPA